MIPVEYAKTYAAIGWHVFPIERGTKRPIGRLTPNGHLQATTDTSLIATWWGEVPDAGIGVAVLPSRLVVVDVDPRNGGHFDLERIETEHGRLQTDVEAYTGGGGQHLVFLAPADTSRLPGKLSRGIDLKSDGYIVVEPSVHPSGRAYEWEASSSPLEGCVPSPLPGWIADMARPGAVAHEVHASVDASVRARSDDEIAEIRHALSFIPPEERDTWLHVGMALHKDLPGALGFELWATWSATSPKYDPQDQQRVWRSFKRLPMGQALQLGTVFDMAYKHGFAKPRPPAPVIMLPEPPEDEAAAPARPGNPLIYTDEPVLIDGPVVALAAMPVEGLNELAKWVFDSAPHAHPLLAQATALALACTCAGRRYVSEFGDPAHAYFGLLTPTTSQARPMLVAAERALMDSGLRRMVRSQRMGSTQQVYAGFLRSPSVLYAADDWGDQLGQARRQPSGLLSITHGVLAGRVHSGSVIALDSWAEVGEKRPDDAPKNVMPTLYAPSMTLLACISQYGAQQAFKLHELGRGALDTMLILPVGADHWEDRESFRAGRLPATAAQQLRWLRGIQPGDAHEPDDTLLGNLVLQEPTPTEVRFAAPLGPVEQRWIARARAASPVVRSIVKGYLSTMRRLCVAMAAYADPVSPVITADMLAWCDRFTSECLDCAIAEFEARSEDDGERRSAADRVLDAMRAFGRAGVPKRDLPRLIKPYRRLKPDERSAVLEQLLTDKEIVEAASPSGRGSIYIHASFVSQEKA